MTRPTIREGDGDPRHGSVNGYVNLSCRCQSCRTAWAGYVRDMREAKGHSIDFVPCPDCTPEPR